MNAMLNIQCSGCSGMLQVPATAAGKKVRCRKCQSVTIVPITPITSEPDSFAQRCVNCGEEFQSTALEDLCWCCTAALELGKKQQTSDSDDSVRDVAIDHQHDLPDKSVFFTPDPRYYKGIDYSASPPNEPNPILGLTILCGILTVAAFVFIFMTTERTPAFRQSTELPETQVEPVASAPSRSEAENIRVPWQNLLERLKDEHVRENWLRKVEGMGEEFSFTAATSGISTVDNDEVKLRKNASVGIVNHSLNPIAKTATIDWTYSLTEYGVDKRTEASIKQLVEMDKYTRKQEAMLEAYDTVLQSPTFGGPGDRPRRPTAKQPSDKGDLNATINKKTTRTYRLTAYWDKGWKIEKIECSADKQSYRLLNDQSTAVVWFHSLFSKQ